MRTHWSPVASIYLPSRYPSSLPVPRPYCIPIPDWASPLFVLMPCGMIIVLFTLASWTTYMFVVAILAFGFVVNILLDIARRRKWCEFRPQTYSKISEIQMTSQDGKQCHEDDSFLENSNGIMS